MRGTQLNVSHAAHQTFRRFVQHGAETVFSLNLARSNCAVMNKEKYLMTAAVLRLFQILAFAVVSYAQAPMAKNMSPMEQANQSYFARDWGAAAQAFASITQAEPANALAWLRLGVSRHKLAQYDQALVAFKRIEADPQLGGSACFRESATLLQLKRKEDALAALNRAIDAGFIQTNVILQDPDLASLRDDPAFKKVIARAEAIAHPCAHQPEYRQFDFWIGEWNVVTTQGQNPAGTSSIQLILDQCVILENWTGGGTGKSFNHYDTRLKKWIQDWVDSQSNSVHFEGGVDKDGIMHYYADDLDP
jgi:tetratricopeptide (TPR) repeat protein